MNYEKLQWTDLVKDQNGRIIQDGTPLSAKNMNRMEEGIDLSVNLIGLLVAETLGKIGIVGKEIEKWQMQKIQQGVINIYNKAVISGCVINPMLNSRYIQVSKTGTFVEGNISEIYVDGLNAGIKDEQMVAMIPQNTSNSSVSYFVYVEYNVPSKKYKVMLANNIPEGKLILYKVTVPANDTKMDLSAVTITDMRRVESNPLIRSTEPFSIVSVPGFPLLDVDYDVQTTVEGASDLCAVGEVIVYDKQANGFKIKYTGSADNVKVRWTIINPDML